MCACACNASLRVSQAARDHCRDRVGARGERTGERGAEPSRADDGDCRFGRKLVCRLSFAHAISFGLPPVVLLPSRLITSTNSP